MKEHLAALWYGLAHLGTGPSVPLPSPPTTEIGFQNPSSQKATHVDIIIPANRDWDLDNVTAKTAERCISLSRNEALFRKADVLSVCYNGDDLVEMYECTYSGREDGSFLEAKCEAIDFETHDLP